MPDMVRFISKPPQHQDALLITGGYIWKVSKYCTFDERAAQSIKSR
jgi:hypothetical protein